MARPKAWLSLLLILIVFGAATYFARAHVGVIENFVQDHPVGGVAIFITFGLVDSTVAPGSMFALIPVAGRLWGPLWATLLTIIGWLWGGVTAFYLAEHFGYSAVRKFANKKHLEAIHAYVQKTNLFWSIVFLRLVFPLDLVSYAAGLFTKMPMKSYILATTIGMA
ncbi:MAG TPA: VTT domain-containing protein, partial [Candidatus Paceibacterota bacterium]|nr:VTT domain-containing protein [Candidatus Paceibacterota bacterium]